MGAQTSVSTSDIRWLTPLPLWMGILTGPIVWAIDLLASYAIVKWVCQTNNHGALQLVSIASLALVIAAAGISYMALVRTHNDVPTDGGRPRQRARFMAILGLVSCGLFGLQIIAGAIPHWVLDACQ